MEHGKTMKRALVYKEHWVLGKDRIGKGKPMFIEHLLCARHGEEHLSCIISFILYQNLVRNELSFLGMETESQGTCLKSNNDEVSHNLIPWCTLFLLH